MYLLLPIILHHCCRKRCIIVANYSVFLIAIFSVLLISDYSTFSAGEELTYDLQTQKRAVIIGETTGGGAHPVQPFTVGNGFVANVPFARAVNPITKSDWETVGVKPDKDVPAGQALDFALKMANDK